ncbi:hypothetical protein A9K55_007033 [Cordyceps militaris]|uniref:DUF8035 domain-containing protein n=1 Tax=Cordyceps militaris TaxID=73501 RepID=A0A2H4SF50_CORMI|nr:hypothetical protein A9K55_007033 [Cordyceps militaris]
MNGSATACRIDEVDAIARALYQRTKQVAPPTLDHATLALRQMHISLRHLRAEAADPLSVLNTSDASSVDFYAAELEPITDHCEFALRQLEKVLDRFDAADHKEALTDRIAAVTTIVAEKEADLAFFLNTVQARPATVAAVPEQVSLLDEMKQDIDLVATKIFSRRSGVHDADPEALWYEFKAELERQDFSSKELETHKVPVKAYIQKLSAAWDQNCGATPTYQSVAEFEANTAPQVQYPVQLPVVPPKVPILPPKESSPPSRKNSQMLGEMTQSPIEMGYSPKEMNHVPKNEKSLLSIKTERPHPAGSLSPTVLPSQYSFNAPNAAIEGNREQSGDPLSTTLVSTKDLVTLDSLHHGMSALRIHTSVPAQPGQPGNAREESCLSPTAVSGSPRYHSSVPMDTKTQTYPGTANPTRSSWLAPDRYGRDIPADAQWTQIRRTLVSPEVLDRAGVRYEARPAYVAVLGRLDRHQIAELARQSAECRAARSVRPPLPPRRSDDDRGRDAKKHSSSDDDDNRRRPGSDNKKHHSDDDILYDSSSSGDSTVYEEDPRPRRASSPRSYPYIVSAAPPPPSSKTSPSTTVKPKPILKNKNENRVRFDPEPHEVEHPSSAPSSYNHDRRRDYYNGGGGGGSSSSRRHREYNDRDGYERGERAHRAHRDRRDTRKKKSWGETLGAVGIGSAALLLGGVGF